MWAPIRGLVSGSVYQQSDNSCATTRFVLLSVVAILLNSDCFFCVLRYVDLLSCGDSGQPQSVQILSCVVWACCLSGDSGQQQSVQIVCTALCGLYLRFCITATCSSSVLCVNWTFCLLC